MHFGTSGKKKKKVNKKKEKTRTGLGFGSLAACQVRDSGATEGKTQALTLHVDYLKENCTLQRITTKGKAGHLIIWGHESD